MSSSSAQKARPGPALGSPWQAAPPAQFPTDWASSFGQDPCGLWCGFHVNDIEQRMRWIPAGEFLMGSPETELERDSDEVQHVVTLTEGYWMADTACTQALWEVVMDENPSRFEGQDRPVEQVSWEDVQVFACRLNERLPGLQARLPTEAEWEYAARAGTQTPFWWGSTLSSEQANYDGNFPYAGGQKDEWHQETVAVDEFAVNPWGLYQVHGNVREWCSDWYGDYTSARVVNPQGQSPGERRVARGGSWFCNGEWLRAANRSHHTPGNRDGNLGFRLAAGQVGAEHPSRTQ